MKTLNIRLAQSVVGYAEAEAVTRILCNDGYLGMGHEVAHFEKDIAQYLGVAPWQVIAVNSGTAALHLAIEATCPIGSAILVPSLTFVASFQAITAARCVPVPCDVCYHNAIIDIHDAQKRLTDNVAAIMPVHYAGNVAQWETVRAFAKKHNIRCIEDAAHAFGCAYKGQKVGSRGDIVCFSFDGIKNITCGEGGCIIAFTPEEAALCRQGRELGIEHDTQGNYTVQRQGWRYHMSNIMAAVGRVQLTRLDKEFAPQRRALVKRYTENLTAIKGLTLLEQDKHAYIIPHIFPVRILHGHKEYIATALDAVGIPTRTHYSPNHLLPFFKSTYPLPITEMLYNELLSLPLHPLLCTEDIDNICTKLIAALDTVVN